MTIRQRQARRLWLIPTADIAPAVDRATARPDYHAVAKSVRSAQAHAWGPLIVSVVLVTIFVLASGVGAWQVVAMLLVDGR